MDINLLLSPQEIPRAAPNPQPKPTATKSRKPRAPKVTQPSPLANATLPPNTLSHSAIAAQGSQHATSSPANVSPTPGSRTITEGTVHTPPVEGATRTNRQPSTPGMDTLADLASMQHHQQTARANAGGLRSAELYDSPSSSSHVLPNLLAMSRTQPSNQLRDPTQSKGGSMDTMTDGVSENPSPKKFSSNALSDADIESVTQLAKILEANPFDYESHVQLINILRQALQVYTRSHGTARNHDLLSLTKDLSDARETMQKKFAHGEDLWADWLQDQVQLMRSPEDCPAMIGLCEKAVEEEPNSTKLWELYGQTMLYIYKRGPHQEFQVPDIGSMVVDSPWPDGDEEIQIVSWSQVRDVWEKGSQETVWRLNDSHLLWDTYTKLILRQLESQSTSTEAVAQVQDHLLSRLKIPHATLDNTFSAYSNFISTYGSEDYESIMVAANRLRVDSQNKLAAREDLEFNLLRTSQADDKASELQAYYAYLEWEVAQSRKKNLFDFGLANALYQRATLRFPTVSELWEAYAMFLVEETAHTSREISAFEVLNRATQHCPWSGSIWSHYILAAEQRKLTFTEVEEIKHKATSSGLPDVGGMEEVLKVHTAWCGFLRRRAFDEVSTDEEMDVAEVGIRSAIENMETLGKEKFGKSYQGDPDYRLEKIYIKYLSQSRKWEAAREVYRSLVDRKGNDYNFWIRYYLWEMGTWVRHAVTEHSPNGHGFIKPREATRVLARAMSRPKLDWPEKIIDTFQNHCEDNEDAEQLQVSIAQISKARNAVQKRREKEALEAYEAAQANAFQQQQQPQQDVAATVGDGELLSKRKREDETEPITSKKLRSNVPEEVEPQMEEQHPSAPSLLKRDRENSTALVKNLAVSTTEIRLQQYFRDCGEINSLKIVPEPDGQSATASIEFSSKEDVLTAQTKDMKKLDGRSIEVQVGGGATLYVCNFPPTADDAWVRENFAQYGEIIDIRFPSLKYNSHRRFCYIQYKSSSEAQAALQLDGKNVGGKLHLLVKISDPGHKQDRHGAMYENREVFLANLDWQATQADVEEAFSKFGTVDSVRIPTKLDGQSKGIGFVVFSNKDEAKAALEMNITKFKNRILNVAISTNDKGKRQATRIITTDSQRSTASPTPRRDSIQTNGGSPAPQDEKAARIADIQARTLALLNVPDTLNDTRVRALAEPYGELVKVSLRPDHQGAILEYKEVAAVGKASLGLEGLEIIPGRQLRVGTVQEMKQHKAEIRSDKIALKGAKKTSAGLQRAPIKRPTQQNTKRGGKGGLGYKKETKVADVAKDDQARAPAKSNADFKAMFLKKDE